MKPSGEPSQQHFTAPWGTKLKVMTSLVAAIGLVVMWSVGPPGSYVTLAAILLAAAFSVRGYSIMEGQVLVHRLGWATRFDLRGLAAVEHSPGATVGSIRVFGVGGLFGFVGRFRNEVLGNYRAYATDSELCVVLEFTDTTVVVTPDRPDDFVQAIVAERKRVGGGADDESD